MILLTTESATCVSLKRPRTDQEHIKNKPKSGQVQTKNSPRTDEELNKKWPRTDLELTKNLLKKKKKSGHEQT